MALNIKKEFGNTKSRTPDMSTMVYGRVPPQAPDMEEAILGACMLERDTFEEVQQIIHSADIFYVDAHQKIFSAMLKMYNDGTPIDLITITEQLRKSGELELVGGAYYLSRLTMSVLSSAHVIAHASIVFEKYAKRETIRICGNAINSAYEDGADAFEVIDEAVSSLSGVFDGIHGSTGTEVGKVFIEVIEDVATKKANPTQKIGIPSGYTEIDALTQGWVPGDMIILAARPSQGKTALGLNITMNSNCPSQFFSLETLKKPLVRRMAAAKSGIQLRRLKTGRISDVEEKLLQSKVAEFNRLPITIEDKCFTSKQIVSSIRAWVKVQRKKNPPKPDVNGKLVNEDLLVVIDYLQLIEGNGSGNREQEISKISRDLKKLAMDLEIPIIALSQLNRKVEDRTNKRPMVSDLRESGAIEQDASIIMLIWWKDTGNKDSSGDPIYETVIIVAKNRDGECGDVVLRFNGDIQLFLNKDDIDQSIYPSFVSAGFQNRDFSVSQKEQNSGWDDDLPVKKTDEDAPF